jgi:UDP-galactopyranose mutase
VPRQENAELYVKYKTLADATNGVHFVGRLATYKYYNMDQVVAQAFTLYAKIRGLERAKSNHPRPLPTSSPTRVETKHSK